MDELAHVADALHRTSKVLSAWHAWVLEERGAGKCCTALLLQSWACARIRCFPCMQAVTVTHLRIQLKRTLPVVQVLLPLPLVDVAI